MGPVNFLINKKSQAAVEFIIILGMLLFVLGILVGVNFNLLKSHENQVRVMKAKDTIEELHKASVLVYSEGKGAKTKVFVTVPSAVFSTSTKNQILMINLSLPGDIRSINRKTGFDIQGDIPKEQGYYWINVTSYGDYVEIKS